MGSCKVVSGVLLPSVSLGVQAEEDQVKLCRCTGLSVSSLVLCDNKCRFPMSLHNCLIHYALDP